MITCSLFVIAEKESSCGRSELNNVSVVNMKHVANVKIIKENNSHIPETPALSASKVGQMVS